MMIFKQYGEERSGTNYLKFLLESNFADVTVFGSVLGWKHGMFQLTNGHQSPSALDHEDWVHRKHRDGQIFSVDNYPLPFTADFLLNAARRLNYFISYKPLLPWLVSVKRFRFPKRDYDEPLVRTLIERHITGYCNWLALPNALLIDHEMLIDKSQCRSLLVYIREHYGLALRNSRIRIERPLIKASTDHGLLISDTQFDAGYYHSRSYLDELPPWVTRLVQENEPRSSFADQAAISASSLILRGVPARADHV